VTTIEKSQSGDPAEHSCSAKTILVVEDDRVLLGLIRKRLGDHAWCIDAATSGREALRWLQERSALLMLLDYHLPDMSGEELLSRMEAQGTRVPFVVATGHGSEAVAVKMMKLGALDYLVKDDAFLKLLPPVVQRALDHLEQEARLAAAEAELRRAHDQLEQRVRQRTAELAEANARLRSEVEERRRAEEQAALHRAELAHVGRLSTVGEMVAELAHELNQPLAAISTYAQVCERLLQMEGEEAAEDLLSSIQRIDEQARRAAEIIRRLRRFSKKSKPSQQVLDVNHLVRAIAVLVDIEARTSRIDLRFDLAEPIPPVLGDRIQIEQVLANLIRNGIEAMGTVEDARRVLTVRTRTGDEKNVEVAVHDRGSGIPAGMQRQIFDRFFTTKPHGMGIGLPISRSIIESHGGRLWAVSNSDGGTTFKFELPIHVGGPLGER